MTLPCPGNSGNRNLYRPRFVLAALAFCVSASAFAQYAWTDEKGVRQYSDRPPPASVPNSRILKQPGFATHSPIEAGLDAGQHDAEASKSQAANPTPTLAERNTDYKRRQAERAEKEKKEAEEARRATENRKNCDRAQEYRRVLESGERIGRVDKNGERSFLTDEQREQEMRETGKILQDCK